MFFVRLGSFTVSRRRLFLSHFQSTHRTLSIVHDRAIRYRVQCLSVNDRQSMSDTVNGVGRRVLTDARYEKVKKEKKEKKTRVYRDHRCKMKKRPHP